MINNEINYSKDRNEFYNSFYNEGNFKDSAIEKIKLKKVLGIKKGTLKGVPLRSRTESNRRSRFCRPVPKPLGHATI